MIIVSAPGLTPTSHSCAEYACSSAFGILRRGHGSVLFRAGPAWPFDGKYFEHRIEVTNRILSKYGLPSVKVFGKEQNKLWTEVPATLGTKPMLHALMRLQRNGGNFLETMLEAISSVQSTYPTLPVATNSYSGSESFLGRMVHPALWAPIFEDGIKNPQHWLQRYRNSHFLFSSLVWKGDYPSLVQAFSHYYRDTIVGVDRDGYYLFKSGKVRAPTYITLNVKSYRVRVYYQTLDSVVERNWPIGGYDPNSFPKWGEQNEER